MSVRKKTLATYLQYIGAKAIFSENFSSILSTHACVSTWAEGQEEEQQQEDGTNIPPHNPNPSRGFTNLKIAQFLDFFLKQFIR